MIKKYILFFLIATLFSAKVQAQYAVGGTSENYNSVYWLTWNPDYGNPDNPLIQAPTGFGTQIISGSYTWMYSSDIRIIANVTNLDSGELEPYTPGTWRGDGLGYLYSGAIDGGNLDAPQGVPHSGMATPNGVLAQFGISLSVEFLINGSWIPVSFPGIVIADAEELNGSTEYMAANTNAPTAWQLMDLQVRADGTPDRYFLNLSGMGTEFELYATGGTDSGTQAVMYAHGATALPHVEMQGGGKSALAIGFVFPFDLGDAPATYGDKVKHYIDSFHINEHFPGDGEHTVQNYPVTPLFPKASVFIGADNVDADGLGALQNGSDSFGANNDQYTGAADEETIDVSSLPIKVNQDGELSVTFPVTNRKGEAATVYMWMDFNSNGSFEADELITIPISASVTDQDVTAVFSKSMFAGKLKAGSLYSRIRITTTSLQDDPATAEFDERATTLAADGETEDYRFSVEGVIISGSLRNDANGLTDSLISGPGIDILDEMQLYAYLVNDANQIEQKYKIAYDGNYSFGNVNPGNYRVRISTLNLEPSTSLSFSPELPTKWRSVGQSYGENNAAWNPETPKFINDPNMDLEVVIPMDGTDIFEVDFAVEMAPTAMDISIPPSPAGKKVVLPETFLNNFLSDREDAHADLSTLRLFDEIEGMPSDNLTVPGEGTYTIVRGTTTNIEFSPSMNFSGETTPISYMIRDSAGVESNLGEIIITIEEPSLIITNPMIYQRVN